MQDNSTEPPVNEKPTKLVAQPPKCSRGHDVTRMTTVYFCPICDEYFRPNDFEPVSVS